MACRNELPKGAGLVRLKGLPTPYHGLRNRPQVVRNWHQEGKCRMIDSSDELLDIATSLEELAAQGRGPNILGRVNRLRQAAEDVGKAWSNSWMGVQANTYYADLDPPPPGMPFNTDTRIYRNDGWNAYEPEQVASTIRKRAGNPDMGPATDFVQHAAVAFRRHQSTLLSIIEVASDRTEAGYLLDRKERITQLHLVSENDYINSWTPTKVITQESLIRQGKRTPPHLTVLAKMLSVRTTIENIAELAEIARQVAEHLARQDNQPKPRSAHGTNVFIGHGNSPIWLQLKDFIGGELGLSVDEFDGVPTAGMAISDRLMAMLDSAGIAFLVMTGEDEQPSGELRPRENVVHEAGLFQGKLGFERAIVLLEEGCEKFSNNAGLVHISFRKDNITDTFHGVRKALEREGMLPIAP